MTDQLLETGTWSSGTLRDEDLASMFSTIATVTECEWCKHESFRLRYDIAWLAQWDADEWCTCIQCTEANTVNRVREDISEMITYLFDHVEEHHTPEGFYFGSHPGDGADFGVWESESV